MIRWDLKKINQTHILSGEVKGWDEIGWSDEKYSNNWSSSLTTWRGWDGMIRWEVFKQLRQSSRTFWRQAKGWNEVGWSDEKYSNTWPSSHTSWRRWNGMIRWEVFKQLTKFTYFLESDEENRWREWVGKIRREVFATIIKFTYRLKTGEGDGMGRDDQMRGI